MMISKNLNLVLLQVTKVTKDFFGRLNMNTLDFIKFTKNYKLIIFSIRKT